MKIRLSITVVFGLLLAAFGLFNQKPVEVVLLGVNIKVSSQGMVVLYAFLTGAFYSGIIAAIGSVRLRSLISRQKTEMEEMRDRHEETLDSIGYAPVPDENE